jgi:hypothetical protein
MKKGLASFLFFAGNTRPPLPAAWTPGRLYGFTIDAGLFLVSMWLCNDVDGLGPWNKL